MESKPAEKEFEDLRLNQPFASLSKFAMGLNLDQLDDKVHSHVPYVVIILQALEKWKQEHEGKPPSTMAEKKAFTDAIKAAKRSSKEVNFDEAATNAYKSYVKADLSGPVQDIIDSPKAELASKLDTSPFWNCAAALKEFYNRHKTLPVAGVVPDMTSTTEFYLQL